MGGLEGADHLGHVMAIDRAHVGEAELLKHSPQLGHGQTTHALLEVLELRRQFTVHERQVLDRLFSVAGEELHRLAEAHPVEVGRERSHRR